MFEHEANDNLHTIVPIAKMKRNKLFPVAQQVIHAYVEGGATIAEIGAFFDCSEGTVRNLLLIRGVTMRPRGRKKRPVILGGLED
jgi:hypothetical protein